MSQDLVAFIDLGKCSVSNAAAGADNAAVLLSSSGGVVRSDVDAQLLITVVFKQPVKLTGVALRAVAGEAPSVLKLFAERTAFSFDDVEATPANAAVSLNAAACAGKTLALNTPGAKFPASVSSVAVFLDCEGADATAVSSLTFFGAAAGAGADLTQLKAG